MSARPAEQDQFGRDFHRSGAARAFEMRSGLVGVHAPARTVLTSSLSLGEVEANLHMTREQARDLLAVLREVLG